MRNYSVLFNQLNEEDVQKCIYNTFNQMVKRGFLKSARELFGTFGIFRHEVCSDALTAFYSGDMFERGRLSDQFDFGELEYMESGEQFIALSRFVKRYMDSTWREHRLSINGRKFNSTNSFSEFPSVKMKDGERVSFEDTIVYQDENRVQMNEEMKEFFNHQMKRLNDKWYKAVNLILDDLVTGAFGSYISVNGEMKISKAILELSGEYVGYGYTKMREKFNDFISDVRRAYRG